MNLQKERNRADEHIRIPKDVKDRLDEIARYLAEQRRKKDVSYGEVVCFLIDIFEKNQK